MCNVNVVNRISCFGLIIYFLEGIGGGFIATRWLRPSYAPACSDVVNGFYWFDCEILPRQLAIQSSSFSKCVRHMVIATHAPRSLQGCKN